jgi:hypothetical protein
MGRPLIEITPELCKKAETLAAQGLTMDQIALTLNMGKTTLYEKVNKYTEFSNAIEAGRGKGIAAITNALFKKAKDGDVTAQKYYLNNRDNKNWKDRIDSTVTANVEVRRMDELSDEELLAIAATGSK